MEKDIQKKRKYEEDTSTSCSTEDEEKNTSHPYREAHNIQIEGKGAHKKKYRPYENFKDTPFCESVLQICKGFEKPTPIQAQSWPIQVSGKDMIGIARTGSGKTLAFGMPVFQRLIDQELVVEKGCPKVLVICPTRELALQSHEVFQKATDVIGVKSLCVYGGVSKGEQAGQLRKKNHVVIATPGRLMAFMDEETVSLSSVNVLVLDEADRMLDMGFEDDMRKIIKQCPEDRQTVMFSATWPESVRALASEFLSSPLKITIGLDHGTTTGKLAVSASVSQKVEVIDPKKKNGRLLDLIRDFVSKMKKSGDKGQVPKILVFALYKKEAAFLHSFLEKQLQRDGLKVNGIHGDMTQDGRTNSLNSFKTGQCQVLVATDVAGRGLDIPQVHYVINVTFPLTIEDYVHRIGRTGRGNLTGQSHTFFTQLEKDRAGALVDVLRGGNAEVPKELLDLAGVKEGDMGPADTRPTKKKKHALYGDHFKEVDMSVKGTHVTFDSDDD